MVWGLCIFNLFLLWFPKVENIGRKAAVNSPPYFFIVILFLIICQHWLCLYISVLRKEIPSYESVECTELLVVVVLGRRLSSLCNPQAEILLTFCFSSSTYAVSGIPLGEFRAFPLFLEIPENLDSLLQHPDAAVTSSEVFTTLVICRIS